LIVLILGFLSSLGMLAVEAYNANSKAVNISSSHQSHKLRMWMSIYPWKYIYIYIYIMQQISEEICSPCQDRI
jgi:uncharacterized protein (UPF0333 family)